MIPTNIMEVSDELYEEFQTLLSAADAEKFEDGKESVFSKRLVSLVKKYGAVGVEVIKNIIFYENKEINVALVAEAFRWLGNIDHPPSHAARLDLLELSLSFATSRLRDGAILGLSYLNDPHAIFYLKRAITSETSNELRKDRKQVLAQLKSITYD
jgi:hypothetical protein